MSPSIHAGAFDLQGHRGARGHAPENTLPGFERAIAIGVTTLELDVGVTRDGVVVIHHDRGLNPDTTRGPDGQWIAVLCLGVFGGAAAFYLWVYALERTTPTRVANTMTVNPIAASLLAAVLIGEPLGAHLAFGVAAVGAGVWLASSTPAAR